MDLREKRVSVPLVPMLLVLCLSFGIALAGWFFYASEETALRASAEENLSSIAGLKIKQLMDWRRERLGDARMFSDNPFNVQQIQPFLEDQTGTAPREDILAWMKAIRDFNDYQDVVLVDAQGVERLVVGTSEGGLGAYARANIVEVLRTGQPMLSDIHRGEYVQELHIDLYVPLHAGHGSGGTPQCVGVFLLRIIPDQFLYPLIQWWPVPSVSAETLLVRREGEEVVFLNELKLKKAPPLSLRFPVSTPDLPAAMAARGEEGVIPGKDYRGVRVLSAIRRVPDSPWYMVSKVDEAEILAPLRAYAWFIAAMTVTLIVFTALVFVFWWKRRETQAHLRQYEAEKAFRQTEDRLRALFTANLVGIRVSDIEGNVREANDEFLRTVGYTRSEFNAHGLRVHEVTPPDHQAVDRMHFEEAKKTGICAPYEKQYLRRDGSRGWALIGYALAGEQRDETVAFVLDITEKKRVELQLRQNNEVRRVVNTLLLLSLEEISLEEILERALETILSIDWLTGVASGAVFLVEKGGEELVLKTHRNMSPGRLTACGTIPFGKCHCGNAAASGQIVFGKQEDGCCRGAEDESRHAFYCVPLVLSGKTLGVIALCVEASHVRDAREEEFLRTLASVLTGIVRHKRAEEERQLLEVQLAQSQKMESIGSLAGGVAHDFNNMLSVILGHLELLLEDLPAQSRSLREPLGEIQKAAERARDLTHQLLAFGRKQVLRMQMLDLTLVVGGFEKMLSRIIGEDIELSTCLAKDLGLVRADPVQIEQVLLNLAVNARDAMAQGGKLIIETMNIALDADYANKHTDVTPGDYVMLAVSDTGQGMDGETQRRVFEPFFTTKERGTGLGLATVYGIVKQHGGNIWVYSEPGRGTVFKVYLPRVSSEEEDVAVETADFEGSGGSETILVVEDDASVRALVCAVLAKNGYQIIAAPGPCEALRLAEEHGPIQLLLTDVVMPEMSGREVYEQVIALQPDIKVVFMSGYTDNVIAHHGVLDKGLYFIQKPFTTQNLTRCVRAALSGVPPVR